jgi:hypothetical protein
MVKLAVASADAIPRLSGHHETPVLGNTFGFFKSAATTNPLRCNAGTVEGISNRPYTVSSAQTESQGWPRR